MYSICRWAAIWNFVVTKRGNISWTQGLEKEIREPFFKNLFTETPKTKVVQAGEADFPTGEVVLADPIAYLGSQYETVLDRMLMCGKVTSKDFDRQPPAIP